MRGITILNITDKTHSIFFKKIKVACSQAVDVRQRKPKFEEHQPSENQDASSPSSILKWQKEKEKEKGYGRKNSNLRLGITTKMELETLVPY